MKKIYISEIAGKLEICPRCLEIYLDINEIKKIESVEDLEKRIPNIDDLRNIALNVSEKVNDYDIFWCNEHWYDDFNDSYIKIRNY